jgi:hypothetical protein
VFGRKISAFLRRIEKSGTGFVMTFLWTCIAIATPLKLVKYGVGTAAAWKLVHTLNGLRQHDDTEGPTGGGTTSSAAAQLVHSS